MNQLTTKIQNFLHFFHRPFSAFIPQQQFRYLAAGGSLALWDAFTFFICINYIFHKQPVNVFNHVFQPYILAFWIIFPINLTLGFLSSKYVVFPGSHLPHGTQLFRYLLLVGLSTVLNFYILKFFIQTCLFYPTPAKLTTTLLVAFVSYVWQRHITFKTKKGASH